MILAAHLITATALLVIGTGALAWMSWILFVQISRLIGGTTGASKLVRARKRLERADLFIRAHDLAAALLELKAAVSLERANSKQAIASFRDHHQNVLTRLVIIAEEQDRRIYNIAEVERLFFELAGLQAICLSASDAFTRLRSKREQNGKAVPLWSQTDFHRRTEEAERQLTQKTAELAKALSVLFSSLAAPTSDNVTYH